MADFQLIYKTSFYMVAAAICISALIFVLIEGWLDRKQTRVYLLLLFDVMLSAFGGIIYKLSQPYAAGNTGLTIFMLISQFFDFFAHTALAPLFFIYVQNVTGAIYKASPKRRLAYLTPFIVAETMVLFNPVVGWVYYFDEEYNFYRNWGESITYVVAGFYFALSIFNMLFYWQAVNRRRRLGLLYAFLIVFAGIVIQLVSINLSVELMAEAMGLVIIMLVVEREDDRLDQSTRTYNRRAFHTDLNNCFRLERHFRLINIRILNGDILQRLTGSTDDDSLYREVVLYLREIHSKYQIYRVHDNSFMLVFHNGKEGEVSYIAEQIRKRFLDSFHCNSIDVRLKALIICAAVPEELKTEKEIMQLVDCRTPDIRDDRVLQGKDVDRFIYGAALEKALFRGIKEHNYAVNYQPIYNKRDKSIFGAEASISLNDPELGMVEAKEILSVAGKQGIDLVIDNLLLDEVCMFLGSGIPTELGLLGISVRISVRQCTQPDFISMLDSLIERYNILPSMLILEIPEPADPDQYSMLSKVMKQLKEKGFVFSLDGFGTGYTNMQAFSDLGFDIVNMNAAMLGKKEPNEVGISIMKHSIRMIRDMKMKILIKDVTTKEQIDWIEQTDVEYMQGEYYSKVITSNELISILRVTEIARQDEQRARAGSEAKSNFLANMSHEIRTPINAILGMNEMILRESRNEAVLNYAKDIANASRSLLSLINDVLDFSKIEAGNMEIVPVEYALSTLLNDLINMVIIKAEQKGIDFVVDVEEDLPELLYGDEMRIRQIVLNLLNNAVKYTDEGRVSFTVRGVFSSDHSVRLVFDITDTGRGIKKEDQDELFKIFRRLDMQNNRTIEGTGLGLAIAHNLISLMDGNLQMTSEYGKGSSFVAVIPQQAVDLKPIGDFRMRHNEGEGRSRYHEKFIAPTAHILIVDDTPMNLTVIKSLLKKTRIHIDTALSGKECLELCAVTPYDIIFLDYRMPEMDGVTTLKIMREMSEHPNENTPIILLTANALAGAREQFLRAGFDDYMTKPIDGGKLEEMLVRYLPEEKVILQDNIDFEEQSTDYEIIEKLEEYAGLDTDQGLSNCGSVEGYMEVVGIYLESLANKAAEIEKYYQEEDYENYTIQVHSLKSTSKVIGAMDISERAWELECAGDENKIDVIKAKTMDLLADYRTLGERLSELMPKEESQDEEELNDIDDAMLNDAYKTLLEFAMAMDYEDSVFVLDELRNYRVSKEEKERITAIHDAVERLDWDAVKDKINERGGM